VEKRYRGRKRKKKTEGEHPKSCMAMGDAENARGVVVLSALWVEFADAITRAVEFFMNRKRK